MAQKLKAVFDASQDDSGLKWDKSAQGAKQSFKEECDINTLMRQYTESGVLPNINTAPALYGDYSNAPDYMAAMETVIKAQEQFEGLPAEVRQRFNHDPATFLNFATDPANLDEMVKLKLAIKKEQPAPKPATAPVTAST